MRGREMKRKCFKWKFQVAILTKIMDRILYYLKATTSPHYHRYHLYFRRSTQWWRQQQCFIRIRLGRIVNKTICFMLFICFVLSFLWDLIHATQCYSKTIRVYSGDRNRISTDRKSRIFFFFFFIMSMCIWEEIRFFPSSVGVRDENMIRIRTLVFTMIFVASSSHF